jgi:hypothetical protein
MPTSTKEACGERTFPHNCPPTITLRVVAALVLEIVRIGLAHDLGLGLRPGSRTLRRIFLDRIGHSKDSATNLDKFIVVDDVFGRYMYARMLAADGPEDQIETVATMARELLDKYSSGSRRDNPLSPLAL